MSAWTTIANAVAEKFGVEDESNAKDRIGKINEDRMNDKDVESKTFKNGDEAVQFGGKGVGGNAVAKFGADDGTEADMSAEAADAFAGLINTIKQNGLAEEVLVQDDLTWKTLAEGFGATGSKEIINPDNSDFDQDRDFTNTFENSKVVDIDYKVSLVSKGIGGGNANATFETEGQVDAFLADAESIPSAELLGIKGGPNGIWKDLSNEYDATKTVDTFTFKDTLADDVADDPEITLTVKEVEEFGWTVQVGGLGVGGNAAAHFNNEADALAFEALVDQLIDLGLADELF